MGSVKSKTLYSRISLGLRLGLAGAIFLIGAYPLALIGVSWLAGAEPPTLEEMRESCRESAALNGTTPDDWERMSQCVDAWVISTHTFAEFFLILLLVISGAFALTGGFWLRRIFRGLRKVQ